MNTPPAPIVLLQGSLNPQSKTALVVEVVAAKLQESGIPYQIIDLRHLPMEFCDGRDIASYNAETQSAYQTIQAARAVIIGMPVYCYSVAGPLKNFLDITSQAFIGKYIGVLCNAGSPLSYLAAADLMKILSYESFAVPVQPTVLTSTSDFESGVLTSEKAKEKIETLISVLVGMTG